MADHLKAKKKSSRPQLIESLTYNRMQKKYSLVVPETSSSSLEIPLSVENTNM